MQINVFELQCADTRLHFGYAVQAHLHVIVIVLFVTSTIEIHVCNIVVCIYIHRESRLLQNRITGKH